MAEMTCDRIIDIWLNLLTKLPKWNVDKSVLYLIDVLARSTWPDMNSANHFRQTLYTLLQESDRVQRPSKGLA